MAPIFADTAFWVALLNPGDKYHNIANFLAKKVAVEKRTIYTSHMVLTEVLNFFSQYGSHVRDAAAKLIEEICTNKIYVVIEQNADQFHKSRLLYSQRLDKEWGQTDCSSMLILDQIGISDVLTSDHHFQQAGYVPLMKSNP